MVLLEHQKWNNDPRAYDADILLFIYMKTCPNDRLKNLPSMPNKQTFLVGPFSGMGSSEHLNLGLLHVANLFASGAYTLA